ncbi:WhiB family transcriptional regulator [Streptomyces sp. NPDC060022]|uniref:WhiB family transcriptional regulator n=1 Tax=Streptomyces sp. NPDC060022 TaxID=3347039 RepID=UPI0036A4869A
MNPYTTGDTLRVLHDEPPHPACHDADPALFFPSGDASDAEKMIASAKNLCRHCPVRRECLTHAIRHSETEGIWGGFTMGERRRLREQANRLRAVSPQLIMGLQEGRAMAVSPKERPGVVLRLLGLGWSEVRIADALRVAPFAVETARRLAENAAAYRAAERQARQ